MFSLPFFMLIIFIALVFLLLFNALKLVFAAIIFVVLLPVMVVAAMLDTVFGKYNCFLTLADVREGGRIFTSYTRGMIQ